MNKAERIIGLVIIGLAIMYGSLCIFLNVAGQSIICGVIENLTHKKTTIGYFNLSPMLNLEIKKLDCEGLAKIDSISISPDILGLLTGKLAFNNLRIVSPEITIVQAPPAVVSEQKTSVDLILPAAPAGPPAKPKEFRFLPFGFKRIRIDNGTVNYIDQGISADGIKIVLKDINCKVSNLYFYPKKGVTNFELRGKIPWREGEANGQLDVEGWLNFSKKNMQATLKIKDIDAIYLYPYYSQWVDLEKARIEKAKLNFSIDVNGLNNNITAECHLELTDLVRKPLEPGVAEEKASKVTNQVLDIFKNVDEGKVELNFSVKTKMDSPQFGFGNFKGALEDKITKARSAMGFKAENTLALPFKILENGVKSFTDLTRATIDGIFAIGGSLGQSAN